MWCKVHCPLPLSLPSMFPPLPSPSPLPSPPPPFSLPSCPLPQTGHLLIKDLLSSVMKEQILEVCQEQVEVAQDEQAVILDACQKLIEGVVSEEACIVSHQALAETTAERDMHL